MPERHSIRGRLPPGPVSVLEILVLGPLAAYLVLWVIPSAFQIEWECVGDYGVERVPGDTYLGAAGVVGTFGWLGVAVGVLYAQIAESPRLAVLLPLAWFVSFVAGALLLAAALPTQLCPA